MPETYDRLMDAAENSMRLRGYHAVSFRELADELEIKSSSVHYYFRHKEDLGVALVKRYSENFFTALEALARDAGSPEQRLDAYRRAYRDALRTTDKICLCVMLGAEACGLPDTVAGEVRNFFEANIKWLIDAQSSDIPENERRANASRCLATLQGAMILASVSKDYSLFDEIAARTVH